MSILLGRNLPRFNGVAHVEVHDYKTHAYAFIYLMLGEVIILG